MKNIPLLVVVIMIFGYSKLYSQVGIGTTNPHESSILDVQSTTKGFLPPRLTSFNRDNIVTPAEGLVIYNSDLNCLEFFTGQYWFNPCCSRAVNSGLNSIPLEIYFNLNDLDQIEKMNVSSGLPAGPPVHDDFLYSYNSLVNGDSRVLTFSTGVLEGNDVFQFKDETSSNLAPYKKRRSVLRTVNKNLIGYNGPIAVASLQYDFTPDYSGEFELFLIAKVDSTSDNIVPYSAFFSSSDGAAVNNSLQLGLGSPTFNTDISSGIACETNYFRLQYRQGTTNKFLCGSSLEKRVAVNDGQFHVFNIIQRNHTNGINKVLELNIDGELVAMDETLTVGLEFNKLKLFSNRKGDKAMKSEISDLLFFSEPLNEANNDKLSEYLVCKYGR